MTRPKNIQMYKGNCNTDPYKSCPARLSMKRLIVNKTVPRWFLLNCTCPRLLTLEGMKLDMYVHIYIYSCYIAFLSDPSVWYTNFRRICFIFWDVFHYQGHLTRSFCVYEIDFRYHHINPWETVSPCKLP